MDVNKLSLLKQFASMISMNFGPDYEIVVHDLSGQSLQQTIVHIENGNITGREIGDYMIPRIAEQLKAEKGPLFGNHQYKFPLKDGKTFHSTIMAVANDREVIEAILAINYIK